MFKVSSFKVFVLVLLAALCSAHSSLYAESQEQRSVRLLLIMSNYISLSEEMTMSPTNEWYAKMCAYAKWIEMSCDEASDFEFLPSDARIQMAAESKRAGLVFVTLLKTWLNTGRVDNDSAFHILSTYFQRLADGASVL
jgi:hypothetical protein